MGWFHIIGTIFFMLYNKVFVMPLKQFKSVF